MFSNIVGSSLQPYLIGSIIFILIYFFVVLKFASKKLKVTGKLFVYSLPFTLVFMVYLSMFLTASINGLYSSIYATNIGSIGGILNNAVANYYIKKDLYGQEAANDYLKKIIETEYKALGVQLQKSRIERLNNKLQKKIGVALTDANINLSSLSEYQTYLTSIYGEFIPGTKVKVNGSSEVCEICNITEDEKVVIKTYAGYKYTYNMEELSIVKTEAE